MGDEYDFCLQVNAKFFYTHQDQNFYKLDYRFLMRARHVQSAQKRKFVKFLQDIKKNYDNCFCVLLWGKSIQIICEVPFMFVITCFCKHYNCPDFVRTVPVFGMLSRCPRLNHFVSVFIFLIKKMFIFA